MAYRMSPLSMPLNDLEGHLLIETFITAIVRETYQHSASRGPSAVAELLVEI